MDYLYKLENRSLYMIREAYARNRNKALLWSIGKDSTTMLWIARKAFFGNIPFPVIHIDTSYMDKEIYEFRELYKKKWGLNLFIAKNESAIKNGMSPENTDAGKCCNSLKNNALDNIRKKHQLKALLLAIRGDDKGIPLKKKIVSSPYEDEKQNNQHHPTTLWDTYTSEIKTKDHLKIHPMLHWTIDDVWQYIKREKIPIVNLYYAKDGKRYKNIGCTPCSTPVNSKANTIEKIIKELKQEKTSDQNNSLKDKEDEYTIQKLKSLGYM